ncbi:hypothetical protein D3C75_1298780 [compost metagenome]
MTGETVTAMLSLAVLKAGPSMGVLSVSVQLARLPPSYATTSSATYSVQTPLGSVPMNFAN